METNIKKWSVGSPIQAALDSLELLSREYALKPDQIDRISVRMSDKESHVVDDRNMPDINLQHLLALLAVDGTLTFASSHDGERMNDPAVAEVRNKVALIPDSGLPRRRPIIEIATADAQTMSHATPAVRGTPENPMPREEVEKKAIDLMGPILGASRSRELADTVWALERVKILREFRGLWIA
ncbi:MAG: hypothetical protein VCE91_12540 [Nitrospinota bacterium]